MSCQLISIIAADVWFCQEKTEICLVLDQRGCVISGKWLPNDHTYVMSLFCRLLSVLTFCWCRSTLYVPHVLQFVCSAWHSDHRAGSDNLRKPHHSIILVPGSVWLNVDSIKGVLLHSVQKASSCWSLPLRFVQLYGLPWLIKGRCSRALWYNVCCNPW